MLCGAESCVEMAQFGVEKTNLLRTILELKHGIPSHDTFSRVLRVLDPVALENAFTRFMEAFRQALHSDGGQSILAVDGKSLKCAYEKGRAHMPPMMVSVWGVTMRMTFAQTEAGEGGEAEAAVKLLKSISLKSCVVTADAIHCDRRVVETVKHRGGDYVIALKRNQRNLLASVTALVDVASSGARSAEISEKGHGRQERRSIVVVPRRVLRTNMASKASSQRLVLPANVLLMAKPVIRSTTTSRLAASRRLIFLRSFEVIGISKTAAIGSRTWSFTKISQEIERRTVHEILHCCAA